MGIRFLNFLYTVYLTTALWILNVIYVIVHCLTLKDMEIVRYRVLAAENMVMIIVFCGLSCHVFGSNIPPLPGKKKP